MYIEFKDPSSLKPVSIYDTNGSAVDFIEELGRKGISVYIINSQFEELLSVSQRILEQLRIMNMHLSSLTDNNIKSYDLPVGV